VKSTEVNHHGSTASTQGSWTRWKSQR